MAGPQVADGGDGLQIWTVTVNILNKELQAGSKGVIVQLGNCVVGYSSSL
jgi:hypothetical protein